MSFGDFFNSSPMGMIFGGGQKNPADAANPYLSQIPDILKQYLGPYADVGKDPGGFLNNLGKGYQQSPGYQFQLQQALMGGDRAAAAGGMAGSPEHEQQNMQLSTNLANQNYNQWLQNALGVYGMGQQAGMGLGQDLASALGQQGQYAYAGQAGQNAGNSQFWNNMMGIAGMGLML